MGKLVDQISIGCAVNVAIINESIQKNSFIKSCIDVPLQLGILPTIKNSPWPFQNASWEAYKLYCMLVVPKELYNLPNNDDFYKSLRDKNIFKNFVVYRERNSFTESPIYYFNSLRNSISHVNYDIKSNGNFEFWDHSPQMSGPDHWHWHVEVSKEYLDIFIVKIAEALFKIYNETETGLRNSNTYQKVKIKNP